MERSSNGNRLIPMNITYAEEFKQALGSTGEMHIRISDESLAELITQQFDRQQAEVVARRLLGQSSFDISEQMSLERGMVEAVLREAPSRLTLPPQPTQRNRS
jgi:DNA-directed RNA polymerase specialized sigma24 family protein